MCFDITYKTPAGKKVWEKVGWTSESYTAQMAAQIRAERMRSLRHGDMPEVNRKKSLTFAEAFALYKKDWLVQVKSAAYDVNRYTKHLKDSIGPLPFSSVTPLELERLKAGMLVKGYSAQTIKHALALVRRVYRKLKDWGIYTGAVPTEKVSMPRVDAARTRYLTQAEAQELLDALKGRSEVWHDITLMSLHTGMRLGEILELRWEDVNFSSGHIHIRDAKAGSRTAFLTSETKALLKARKTQNTGLVFPARGDSDRASTNASRTFARVVDALGFNRGIIDRRQKVVFHTLRHTFASWLAIKGVPLYVIGELLGHKTLEMTKRYSHLCPDAKKEAVAYLDGLVKRSGADAASPHKSSSGKRRDSAE